MRAVGEVSGLARAGGWVAHLRGGGTTPWSQWYDVGPAPDLVPGAQHLELLRRVNVVGRPSEALVERILSANAVGRGAPDLPLTGVPTGGFGPSPVDPAAVPPEELLRIATGILAADLATGGLPGPPPTPTTLHRVGRRLRRRRYRLQGDPLVSGLLRDRLIAEGRGPSAAPDRVLVVAGPLDRMLAGAWIDACFSTPAISWEGWLAKWRRLDRVPPRIDLAVRSRELARDARVTVAFDPDDAARAVGARPRPVTVPSPAAAELARRLHGPLGLRVAAHDRDLMIRHRLRPALAAEAAVTLGIPARHRAWVDRHARRISAGLAADAAAGRYAVHGSTADVCRVTDGPATGPRIALDLAVACLLDGRLGHGPEEGVR